MAKYKSPAIGVNSAPKIRKESPSGKPYSPKCIDKEVNQQPMPKASGQASGKLASPAKDAGPDMGKSSHGGTAKIAD